MQLVACPKANSGAGWLIGQGEGKKREKKKHDHRRKKVNRCSRGLAFTWTAGGGEALESGRQWQWFSAASYYTGTTTAIITSLLNRAGTPRVHLLRFQSNGAPRLQLPWSRAPATLLAACAGRRPHVFYRSGTVGRSAFTAPNWPCPTMSLSVQSLNGDTCFLLTFDPPAAPLTSPGLFPGSFTILVDRTLTM